MKIKAYISLKKTLELTITRPMERFASVLINGVLRQSRPELFMIGFSSSSFLHWDYVPIQSIDFLDKDVLKNALTDKDSRLDLKVMTQDKTIVNVEIQTTAYRKISILLGKNLRKSAR